MPVVMHSTPAVARATGLTFRVIDHWIALGVIAPTQPGVGSGSRRRWSTHDVARLAVIAAAADTIPLRAVFVGAVWRGLADPVEDWPAEVALWRGLGGAWRVGPQAPPGLTRILIPTGPAIALAAEAAEGFRQERSWAV